MARENRILLVILLAAVLLAVADLSRIDGSGDAALAQERVAYEFPPSP